MTAPRIRPPRLVMTRARALVTARDSRIAVSTPRSPPSSAAGTATGWPSQEPTCPRERPMSMTAGMPVAAAARSPRASSPARRGRTAKRAGSRIESTPVAMRLSTAHMRVIVAKSGTVRAVIRTGCPARRSRPGPSTASTPSAASPPTTDDTRWRVLRDIAVRHIANRSRTTSRATAKGSGGVVVLAVTSSPRRVSPATTGRRPRRRTPRRARGRSRAASRRGSGPRSCPRRGRARRR